MKDTIDCIIRTDKFRYGLKTFGEEFSFLLTVFLMMQGFYIIELRL